MVVGKLLSYREGNFSAAMLNFGGGGGISSIHSLGCKWRYYPSSGNHGSVKNCCISDRIVTFSNTASFHWTMIMNGRKGRKIVTEPLAITHLANSMHSHQRRNAGHQTGTYLKADVAFLFLATQGLHQRSSRFDKKVMWQLRKSFCRY